jgi:hypothetical protein
MKAAIAARERVRLLNTVNIAAAPTDGVSEPHITLSPTASNGEYVAGFSFSIHAPDAGAAVGTGLTLIVYRLITTTAQWASFEGFAGLDFGEQNICYDVAGGTALFFRISGGVTTDGNILFAVAELT